MGSVESIIELSDVNSGGGLVSRDLSLWKSIALGIVGSLIGGIPVVVIMSAAGMFEKLSAYIGLGENLFVGIVIHFLISVAYGVGAHIV